jgi:hypothetical protein
MQFCFNVLFQRPTRALPSLTPARAKPRNSFDRKTINRFRRIIKRLMPQIPAKRFFEGHPVWRGITSIRRRNEAPPKTKEKNMKTKIVLLGTVVTALVFTSIGAPPLLSPRVSGNQIKTVRNSDKAPAAAVAYVAPGAALLSPRAQGNQIKVAKGVGAEVNPATLCSRYMTGSPKAIQACAANPSAPMPCCAVATAK